MARPETVRTVLLLLMALPFTSGALAGEGRLEINQACAAAGCFPGDTAGLPVEITVSGSYLLTSDVTQSTPNGSGIEIRANDVSLDLNGFTLFGPGSNAGVGISIGGDRAEVKNGSVLDFGAGVNRFSVGDGDMTRVVNLTITNVGGSRAVWLGADSEVRNCVLTSGGRGVTVFTRSQVVGNRIVISTKNPNNTGIEAAEQSIVIRENTIQGATGDGINSVGNSIIAGNIVRESGLSGIHVSGSANIVVGNTVLLSQNYGFEFSGTENLVQGNNAHANNQSAGKFTDYDDCATCTFVNNHNHIP